MIHGEAKVHASALIEDDVILGARTSIWDSCHLRRGAVLGSDCSVGEKTYIAGGVNIADRVKINAFVYLCTGVTLETGVMISAGVVFTNDRYPRATTPDLAALQTSDVTEETLPTLVKEGATVGARAVVGCGLTLGAWSMVGMGSVVTRDVPDHWLVAGVPARPLAVLSRAGDPLVRLDGSSGALPSGTFECQRSGETYEIVDGIVQSIVDGPGSSTWGLA